jgi:hypothetical protein
MKVLAAAGSALLIVLALGGCQTTEQGSGVRQGVSVTRVHLDQPIARGEIAIEPADRAMAGSLEFAQMAAPVERELTRLGWTVVRDNADSEQVALVAVRRGGRDSSGSGSSVSFGVGGGSGGYGSGVGVGVGATVPVGGGPGEIVITELSVRLQRRSEGSAFWEGRAEIEARGDSPLASPAPAVDRLAWALFSDFPGQSGVPVVVR